MSWLQTGPIRPSRTRRRETAKVTGSRDCARCAAPHSGPRSRKSWRDPVGSGDQMSEAGRQTPDAGGRMAAFLATTACIPPFKNRSQERPELLWCQTSSASDVTHGVGVNRRMSGDLQHHRTIRKRDVLALPHNPKTNFSRTLTASRCPMPGIRGIVQTATTSCCTDRTAASPWISAALAARYSPIASRMFANASSLVAPCEQHPGKVSHHTAHPSSDSTKVTGYFISRS